MKRVTVAPRSDLDQRAADLGFTFKDIDENPYWDETAYYEFGLREIETELEDASTDLAGLCVQLVDRAAHDDALLLRLGIPKLAHRSVAESWERADPSLYGRFDFSYDGTGPAKMLEYNADTPTSLYETAVFQWHWLEDLKERGDLSRDADQFNSVHEKLTDRWRELAFGGRIHLASMPNVEDRGTIEYLADCATQAGATATLLNMREIGLSAGRFVDLDGGEIDLLFKLYPWEWMLDDFFGRSPGMDNTRFVEPVWKMVLSTKAILPLLWEMAPDHPNLLPSYFDEDPRCGRLGTSFVRKPLRSREGANVTIIRDGDIVAHTAGTYGRQPHVRQALAYQSDFGGNIPVIGSWIVGRKACGIGIREDVGPITSNSSRFVPHAIVA